MAFVSLSSSAGSVGHRIARFFNSVLDFFFELYRRAVYFIAIIIWVISEWPPGVSRHSRSRMNRRDSRARQDDMDPSATSSRPSASTRPSAKIVPVLPLDPNRQPARKENVIAKQNGDPMATPSLPDIEAQVIRDLASLEMENASSPDSTAKTSAPANASPADVAIHSVFMREALDMVCIPPLPLYHV
jgi:hypothetical protein